MDIPADQRYNEMRKLETIFSSNIPVECHIVKGRLETEGIPCFIFDEHTISIHPFRAVALGGVKLKVPFDKIDQSKNILKLIADNKLIDENGEYTISDVFNNEIIRQNEILVLKSKIRNNESLLQRNFDHNKEYIKQTDIEEIIKQEKEFSNITNKKFKFSWNQFLFELFDFERSVFTYLKPKSVDYYLDKEIVENYTQQTEPKDICQCPNCNSGNVAYGYAIDKKWDLTYLIISLLLTIPFFLIRKNYHCFDCEFNFKSTPKNTIPQKLN